MSEKIHCDEHGAASIAFVCAHVAQSLRDDNPRGFFYTSLEPENEPCAWCSQCDEMREAGGGEWNDELEVKSEIKLLCYECFLRAARLNGVLH